MEKLFLTSFPTQHLISVEFCWAHVVTFSFVWEFCDVQKISIVVWKHAIVACHNAKRETRKPKNEKRQAQKIKSRKRKRIKNWMKSRCFYLWNIWFWNGENKNLPQTEGNKGEEHFMAVSTFSRGGFFRRKMLIFFCCVCIFPRGLFERILSEQL